MFGVRLYSLLVRSASLLRMKIVNGVGRLDLVYDGPYDVNPCICSIFGRDNGVEGMRSMRYVLDLCEVDYR